jgi:uncharacterized protein YqgC (DUF456 family)
MPGLFYMGVIALVFSAIDNFAHITSGNWWVLGGIIFAGFFIDIMAGLLGARYGGAHARSLLFGALGMFVGTFLIPVPVFGTFAGFFLAVFLSEYFGRKNTHLALKAALGGMAGAVVGTGVNILCALAFLVMFLVFAL